MAGDSGCWRQTEEVYLESCRRLWSELSVNGPPAAPVAHLGQTGSTGLHRTRPGITGRTTCSGSQKNPKFALAWPTAPSHSQPISPVRRPSLHHRRQRGTQALHRNYGDKAYPLLRAGEDCCVTVTFTPQCQLMPRTRVNFPSFTTQSSPSYPVRSQQWFHQIILAVASRRAAGTTLFRSYSDTQTERPASFDRSQI